MEEQVGTIRTSIQGQSGSEVAAAALSGGSNLATALSLNACPYRANLLFHHRPLFIGSIEATTILTRGDFFKVQ